MIIWGVNADNHDASIAVVDDSSLEILFAGHAERYSRIKNDSQLNHDMVADALQYGYPGLVVWFENPWGRRARYLRTGQYDRLKEAFPKEYMKQFGIHSPIEYSDHHASHAAGGFYTSGVDEAVCVVIDAIGELTTASIWHATGYKLKKLWSLKYPHSLGLFYSAVTDLVGLKPNEEEYILMGMAAYGDEEMAGTIEARFIDDFYGHSNTLKQAVNFHKGMRHESYYSHIAQTEQGKYDLACAAQSLITHQILRVIEKAMDMTGCDNIVYSGGVALNCLANAFVAEDMGGLIDKFWIMPNPGDAGNSLGAVANHLRQQLKWRGAMLGYDIKRTPDPDDIVKELLKTGICGVASGKAEFGPRALGNRSLLGDPRSDVMKDRVNEIKKRQKFRPFAPAVLDRFKQDHFNFPGTITSTPYMQFVCDVETKELPAITHFDGTARVQTVDQESPLLEAVLERWYEKTGCPVLLNTSLNIKGEPLVNSIRDGERFAAKYGVKVF
jgi:carbamoyltransferase